ncbi:hypothetical protein GCM10018793_37070 [Streptomyces sulfonofaciens]|uniref:DUF2550 family protein n=1 Tax=Streptomyces sulfonofaciens TaxID=68272 RepID=A0A919GBI2_9ACTN|nr:DUF2550 domain-containing protein [Streptomyces sulfonofaciens]GHH80880.1 hypothetical protein GCM10018793_37070 [Streptomyces sulfonofaciens]
MILAVLVSGVAVVALVVLGLLAFGVRRRLIQRSGGTFDCSLRWNVPAVGGHDGTEPLAGAGDEVAGGKGWAYGIARYNGDCVEWFRVFSYAPRPRRTLERGAIVVLGRRTPEGEEELALLSDAIVLSCEHRGIRLELAMSEDALTGFLAWLEAAPPGQRVNVA